MAFDLTWDSKISRVSSLSLGTQFAYSCVLAEYSSSKNAFRKMLSNDNAQDFMKHQRILFIAIELKVKDFKSPLLGIGSCVLLSYQKAEVS